MLHANHDRSISVSSYVGKHIGKTSVVEDEPALTPRHLAFDYGFSHRYQSRISVVDNLSWLQHNLCVLADGTDLDASFREHECYQRCASRGWVDAVISRARHADDTLLSRVGGSGLTISIQGSVSMPMLNIHHCTTYRFRETVSLSPTGLCSGPARVGS